MGEKDEQIEKRKEEIEESVGRNKHAIFQDYLKIAQGMHEMQVPFCMGVGGSFDIIAGRTKRAPVWMQKSGLEWCYRIYQEPRRMWKRYAKTNPVFVIHRLPQYHFPKLRGRRRLHRKK